MVAGYAFIELAGRIMIAFVFLFQGINGITRFDFHTNRLKERGVPAPRFVLACGLIFMLVGGSMVLLNIYTTLGLLLLIIFSLVATVLYQNFWSVSDVGRRREKRGSFLSNVAIIGGLLVMMAYALNNNV